MFKCPECSETMMLPACAACGYQVPNEDGIWILTDAPDLVLTGDGDQYIGYEHIGVGYSGSRRFVIEERDALFAEVVARWTGEGVFLDLGCGDGSITVPCASRGVRIIAGDISKGMLTLLRQRAAQNGIALDNVTLCRMNALDTPLADQTVQSVIANSVLHLISNPGKVITEIYRVLRKGGAFLCLDDRPGVTAGTEYGNPLYNEIVNGIYRRYWELLSERGIKPVKLSWKFDRDAFCSRLFGSKRTEVIKRGNVYAIPLKDGFLPRFTARGFSDQACVPGDLHEEVIESLLAEFRQRYGDDFMEIASKVVESDLMITFYVK